MCIGECMYREWRVIQGRNVKRSRFPVEKRVLRSAQDDNKKGCVRHGGWCSLPAALHKDVLRADALQPLICASPAANVVALSGSEDTLTGEPFRGRLCSGRELGTTDGA